MTAMVGANASFPTVDVPCPTRASVAVWLGRWLGFGVMAWWMIAAPLARGAETRWDPAAAFDEAAKLYERGQFEEATEAYNRLLTNGVTTAAVWFNRGNAYLKQGKTGQAIASYLSARQAAPRDEEVMANLRFARSKVRGGLVKVEPPWARALSWLNVNEWAAVSLVLFWLTGGLLALRVVVPKVRSSTKALVQLAVAVTALSLVPLALVTARQGSAVAVVIKDDAVARFGPLDDAQSAFTLPDGAEVVVTDRKGGWVEVRDLAGRRGWVALRDLVLPPS
ncbi:MAG: tetratricopeptide repeat protein [Verrucomicrobiales bacterium]|nr:tetratricopeptide repeat protein [Verrucomicrobiales bacterium]